MPFQQSKAKLMLMPETRNRLQEIAVSRTQPFQHVERAKILLSYSETGSIQATAQRIGTNRMRINRCVNKALEFGVETALSDLPRSGKRPVITQDAIAWLLSLACQKPKELGYSYELWTLEMLAKHARQNCDAHGHLCFKNLTKGTISKILNKQEIKPHKLKYYLEQRDPAFESKFIQVLYFYKSVNFLLDTGLADMADTAFVSFDEKPGIQAISNLAPDLPIVPGKHSSISRDHQYRRHGTLSLMAGIDLLNGHVHGRVVERHRSGEFIAFLNELDNHYASGMTIRIILDNHTIHTSVETRKYLSTVPNRFEFVFTPKHGSWLNLVETFFSKMSRTLLRAIRLNSKEELKSRIEKYLAELNESPVIFRWKYGQDLV